MYGTGVVVLPKAEMRQLCSRVHCSSLRVLQQADVPRIHGTLVQEAIDYVINCSRKGKTMAEPTAKKAATKLGTHSPTLRLGIGGRALVSSWLH